MAPPSGTDHGVYAVARVGAQCIGIDSRHVVQAVPRPARLVALPRRSGAVQGVFDHGGQLVPVVDLARWVDVGQAPGHLDADDERVLVLRDGGQVIGLRVDALMGVRVLRPGEVVRVHHDDDGEELFARAAAGRGDDPLLAVLEPLRLMRLAAAWCREGTVRPPEALDAAAVDDAGPGRLVGFATFRCGDAVIGIRSTDIGELVPSPTLERVMPAGSGARGICRWRGRPVPVVELAPALDAQPDPAPEPWVCMVRHGAMTVGVPVHEVRELARLDVSGYPRDAQAPALVLGAAVSARGGTLQLLDTAGLFARFPEALISEPKPSGARATASERREAAAYMVFDAGKPFASPVDAVQEVIALPDALRGRLEAGQPATLEWRGHAVPVVDLRQTRAVGTTVPQQLVVVADGEQRAAVAIVAVKALLPACTVTRKRLAAGGLTRIDMVSVDLPDHRASYEVLDLAACLEQAAATG